jgi:hypothetical protein
MVRKIILKLKTVTPTLFLFKVLSQINFCNGIFSHKNDFRKKNIFTDSKLLHEFLNKTLVRFLPAAK